MPRLIGDYRVVDVLGRGGMGVVYQAMHEPTGAIAALKTVRMPTETTLESIRREIHMLRELRHPGVVSIREHGVDGGMPWYAMDLLRGRTLRDDFRAWFPDPQPHEMTTRDLQKPLRGGAIEQVSASPDAPPYSLAHVATLFRKICEPLAYVHGRGVIHRDLSPANVFLVGSDTPVLFDFGLASQFRTDSARDVLEVGGLTRGTAHYMAPEQARGEIVDARADVYALGCMLYEALTGRPPFLGDSALAVLMRHIEELPLPPSAHAQTLPRGFDELVMQMLAKRPRDRIGYAEDVAVRLEALGASPAVAIPGVARPRAYTYRPELAGRTALLDVLDTCLLRLAGGAGGCALLSGESGVGKTRVAGELATRAHDHDVRVITGECEPISLRAGDEMHGAPLHPLRPLLRAVADRARDGGAGEAARLLGPHGGLLAAYEPALAGLAPLVEDRLEPAAARFRVLAVLRDVIREHTLGAPTLLVIDDLQWADELTLAALATLGEGGPPENLFVLATVRAEEMTPEIDAAMTALAAIRYDVPRLDAEAVGRIVRDMLALEDDAPNLTDLITARSEGNPLFAAEYVRAAVDDGVLHRDGEGRWRLSHRDDDSAERLPTPGSVQTLVRRRLRSLTENAREIAMAAAVLGRVFDAELLAAAAGAEAERARDAVAELIQRHVFADSTDGALRFAHDKLREQAYLGLGPEARVAAHGRVAALLEIRYRDGSDIALHFTELAHHWEHAGDDAKAMGYLERAAQHALANAAFGEARSLLHRLLETRGESVEPARRARWERQRGEACYALGDLASTATHLSRALDLLGYDLPAKKLAWSRAVVGGVARQLWARAFSRSNKPRDPDPEIVDAALASARMTSYYFFNDDSLGFLGSALQAINLAERAGEGVPVAEIYAQLAYIAGVSKLPRVERAYFARARETAEATRDPLGLARAHFAEGALSIGRGQWQHAREKARDGLAIAETMHNPQEQEVAHVLLGHCDFEQGDYAASFASATVLYDLAHGRANAQHAAWGVYTQARAHLYTGRLDEAIREFERALAILEGQRDNASHILCGGMLALARARAGKLDAARTTADATTARIGSSTPPVFTISEGFICTAETYLELWRRGDASVADAAKVAIANLARLSRTFPCARPAAHTLAGIYALRAGKLRAARGELAEGLRLAEELSMPYDQALAHWGLAQIGSEESAIHAQTAHQLWEQHGCAWHLANLV
ncbi:MAG TPA: AAA family ATPase [Kofleriaceae bacterium]|jgi:predicted ATPase